MIRNKLLIILVLSFYIFIICPNFNVVLAAEMEYKSFTKQQLEELVPSSSRFVESLDGKWEQSLNGTNWKTVKLPYSIPENKEIIFKRTLKIDRSLLNDYTWHLYFMGIDDEVEVYFNEQFVGRYFGGLTPFIVRVPPKMLTSQTNRIMLKVIPADHGSRQVKEQHLFAKKVYTGVIREILLIGTPHIWVSDLKYKLNFSSGFSKCLVNTFVKVTSGEIEKIMGRSTGDSLVFDKNKISVMVEPIIRKKTTGEIVGQGSYQEIVIQKERTVNLSFPITVLNPILWNVSQPELYQLTVNVKKNGQLIDNFSTDLGFREIKTGSFEGNPAFSLNGKLLEIKGVDYIEDYYHTGPSLNAWRMEKDIMNLKTLGANILRIKYANPNPYFLKLCNKHGIFVMIDLPIYDAPNTLVGSDEIKVRLKNLAERMISAYGNDPSVFAWGAYEGVQENSIDVRKYENFILPVFRKFSNNLIYKTTLLSTSDISDKQFDFIVSRLTGMREDVNRIKSNLSLLKLSVKSKPIIFNFGLPVQPKNHNGYSDPMSVEAQANYIFNLFYLSRNLGLSGVLVWSYNDYELNNPMMLLNNDNKFVCTSGLMDRFRQQRLSFSTLQSLFNNDKDPLFYAGSYSEDTPVTFIIFGLIVSIVLILLINRFKRFREYLFRSVLRPYNFYADIRDQRIMSIVQTYILGLVIAFTLGIFFSSICYFYRTSEIAQYIYMFLFPIMDFQDTLYTLIWVPEILILIIAAIFFVLIFVIAFLIKITSLFVSARIFFSDTFTIAIWSGTPILLLLPLALILNRLLVFSPAFMWTVIIFAGLILLWVVLRVLRSVAVVFDIKAVKSYMVGFGLIVVVFVFALSVYQIKLSVLQYSQYLINVLLKI